VKHPISRRCFSTAGVLGLAAMASGARGQAWPSRGVECIVGYAPGGGVDLVMRTFAPALSVRLGQPVTVVNRPGASGILGAQTVARSRPDGYTLLGTDGGALALNGALFSKLPYDPSRDLAPLSLLIRSPLLLVAHPSFSANDLRSLVEVAKREGNLNYASVGVGSYHHMAMELLKVRAGFSAQDIPYKGQGPAIQDVIAGQVPVMVIGAAGLSQVISGKLKALAVLTHQRIATLPSVATSSEQGVSDAEVYAWVGVAAPRDTPLAIQRRLSDDYRAILAMPEMSKRLQEMGYEPHHMAPEEFSSFVSAEIQRFHPLIRSLGIKLD
jgi:tripartite-type tricarboxylate transporter receptor subunit TctC